MTGVDARVRALVILGALLPGLASCDPSPPVGHLRVVSEVRVDTTIVTSLGAADTLRIDSVPLLWRSPELVGPRSMARLPYALVVADPTRVHFVPRTGREATSVGREGAGPGEYTWIASVGIGRADTVVVYDGPRHRLTYLSREGSFLGSAWVTPHSDFPRVAIEGERLRAWNHGYLWTARGALSVDQPLA